MKDLLEFLLKGILGQGNLPAGRQEFEINQLDENGRILYSIKTDDKNKGLIIGKGGKMINALRQILKVRATLEKTAVNVQVES